MIKGKVVVDDRTKDLVKRIKANEIAVVNHRDIDQVAGCSLVKKRVKAVINVNYSISGKYPNRGPSVLIDAGIPLFDRCDCTLFSILKDGDYIKIKDGMIYWNNYIVGKGIRFDKELTDILLQEARNNIEYELDKFIDNTLNHAYMEKDFLFDVSLPKISINLEGRHVLVVVRGADYREDLTAVRSYIHEINPVIIAVDGGADACLENGYIPDLIIGDMDSVSGAALKCGAEIVVHAYPDGGAPGMERVKNLGMDPVLFPAPGTSEDIALLLAYEKGAELITAVGTHTGMIDFLEKGRPGMGSTFLVRLKINSRLIDARGVSKLYNRKLRSYHWVEVFLIMALPTILLIIFSPPIRNFLQLLLLRVNIYFRF